MELFSIYTHEELNIKKEPRIDTNKHESLAAFVSIRVN